MKKYVVCSTVSEQCYSAYATADLLESLTYSYDVHDILYALADELTLEQRCKVLENLYNEFCVEENLRY